MRGTDRRSARRAQWYGTIATAGDRYRIGLLATACGGAAPSRRLPRSGQGAGLRVRQGAAAALAADLKITPANGSRGVDPSAGISVTALKGKVTNVTVRTSGDAVSGSLSDGGKTWHSARASWTCRRATR